MRGAWPVVVAVALLPACFARRDAPLPNVEPVSETATFHMRATVAAGGGTTTLDGKTEVSYVRRTGTDRSVMAWAAVAPITGNGTSARFVVTVSPFDGDGVYRVPAGAPDGGGAVSTVQMFWRAADGAEVLFERRAEDCTVDVRDVGHRGIVRCPHLVSQDGKTRAGLDLAWDRVSGEAS